MTLQTDRVTMAGLGVRGDSPPDAVQPRLIDGVHLRWMCDPDLGFPWFGFHLFRRPSGDSESICLGNSLARPPTTMAAATPWTTPVGTLESDVALVFTEDFAPATHNEVDLRGRQWARLTLPSGRPARRADVTVGLRQDVGHVSTKRTCVDFRGEARESRGANPRVQDGVGFTVTDAQGVVVANTVVRRVSTSTGPLMGLDCGQELAVRIPCPAVEVELTLTNGESSARARAVNGQGVTVASAAVKPSGGQTQNVVLSGIGIVSVVVTAADGTATLHQICYRCPVDSPTGSDGIEVRALSGATPVAFATVTGVASQVVTVSLRFDEITAVEVRGGPAALTDICVWFVDLGATAGWQRLAEFPSPLSLPVRHPAYPASGGQATDVAAAEAVAMTRVKYGPPADWQGQPFADLHGQLVDLVSGGPSGPTMASRVQTYPGVAVPVDSSPPVTLAGQSILDLLLLASLNAALAQILGLYWVDQTAVPGVVYDYLVVADHSGVGQRDAQHVLNVMASSGFSQLDGWIAFGLAAAPAAALPAPTGLEVFSLPDTDVAVAAPDGSTPAGHGTVGLRWSIPAAPDGGLLPGAPVLYHLWRADLGHQAAPVATPNYNLVTMDGPVLVAASRWQSGASPPGPSDLPPFALHTMDSGLVDGWYGYAVCGVELFGRHTLHSVAAAWLQWAPAPEPRPWYYTDPAGNRVVHPSAVRVLDKTPPPPPPAVEAYTLDPFDPTVVADDDYVAWRNTMEQADQPALVGLRVRWRWSDAQMRQAPDTAEFRIYFNVGTAPPGPDAHEPTVWAERRHVVSFNDHVTVAVDDDGKPLRIYEVLLPDASDTVLESLPLEPTLTEPIAYGHVGVSAVDGQSYTADAAQWAAGHWGGRTGNEGRVGPLAKVWRVWRKKPDAPLVPVDAERVFATRADYHSRSFYTFRWTASTNLKTHVFRAMDETLYRVDWANRPRPAVSPNDVSVFPDHGVDPRWTAAKRQQVASELNHIEALFQASRRNVEAAMIAYRGLSNDALRVLAGLSANDAAFAQITVEPLDPDDTQLWDRPGPDNAVTYTPRSDLRIHIDTLDGRSANRYFYRAAYVDAAHNRGPMSLSGPPVWLHKVVAPRTPVVTGVRSGERNVTVEWAANRDADLAGYRVYRAEVESAAADVRSMTPAATVAPPATTWTDDTSLVGGRTYFYRVTAVDTVGNESPPTRAYPAVAVDTSAPPPPVWKSRAWLLARSADDTLVAWPPDGVVPVGHSPVLRMEWETPTPAAQFDVTRASEGANTWALLNRASVEPSATDAGRYVFIDWDPELLVSSWYRVKVRSAAGVWSADDAVFAATPSEMGP